MWDKEKEVVLDKIIRITEKFKSDYFKSRILASVACKLKEIGEAKRAEEILKKAISIGENLQEKRSDFFILLASELSDTQDSDFQDRSLEFLERGIKYAESIEDNAKRFEALSLACEVLAQMGKFNEAIKLLERVETETDSKLSTDHNLAEALCRITLAGRLDDAIRIAEKFGEPSRSRLLSEIVLSLLEIGDCDAAKMVAEKIDEEQYWTGAMAAISCWLVENERIDEGLKIADEIGSSWDSSPPRAYATLRRLKEGDLEGAIELAKKISNDRCHWVIVRVVEELAKRGEFERAVDVAYCCSGIWYFPEAISKIVRELIIRGRVDDAIKLVEELYPEEELHSPEEKLYILATIPETLLKLGKHEEAKLHSDRILEKLKEFALKTSFDWKYVPIILNKMEKLDEFSGFIEGAKKVFSDRVSMQLYYSVIVGLTEIGEFEGAIELAEEIEGDKERDVALSRICYELLCEDVERAIEIAERISYFSRDRFLRAAVERLAEIDVGRAVEIAERIETDDELYRALRAILEDEAANICCGLVCFR